MRNSRKKKITPRFKFDGPTLLGIAAVITAVTTGAAAIINALHGH